MSILALSRGGRGLVLVLKISKYYDDKGGEDEVEFHRQKPCPAPKPGLDPHCLA